MALYTNNRKDAQLTAVEFSPVSDGNFTFFYIDRAVHKDEIKQWLTSKDIGQEIVAETEVNGKTVYVTHGDKTKQDMLDALAARGDQLALKQPDRKINMWKWRGILSMTGHPMQLAASAMGPKGFNFGVGLFAILNLAANLTNITFGAEKSDDTHRLQHIKNKLNDELGENVVTLEELVPVDEKRAELRRDPQPPKSVGQKFNDFMKRNSVTLGEVGLRYLGGISLVAPIDQWKSGFQELAKTGSLKKFINTDKFIAIAGSFWLAGKTIAFFSKVPDPYNPKPKSTWDNLRENWLFRISTMTEMLGAGTLAVRRYTHGKIKWPDKAFVPASLRGKQTTDYLGTVGGLLFMGAFGMRLFAPYGVKEIDMEEVYAHATDTLAKTPPEKLPQLMADTAASLKEHFKDKNIEFGEIYNKMMADLYRYHHIALDNLGTEPDERRAKLNGSAHAAASIPPQKEESFAQAHPSRTTRPIAAPPASHIEKIAQPSGDVAMGLSA